MKKTLFVFIIVLCVFINRLLIVEGASWRPFSDNNTTLKFTNRGYKNFIDTASVVNNPGHNVRAWKRLLTYDSEKDLFSDYTLVELNCLDRQYRILEDYRVFHEASVINETNESVAKDKWLYLKPEDSDETLYKTWCAYDKERHKDKSNK